MMDYFDLIFLPLFFAFVGLGVKGIRFGRPIMKGKKQYKPWLKKDSRLNKFIGSHFFFGGILFSMAFALPVIEFILDFFIPQEITRVRMGSLSLFGMMSLLGTINVGISFLILRGQVFKSQPKEQQKKVGL